MLRNKSTLLKRIKIAIDFIVKYKNARVMTCGNCGSTNIIPINKASEDEAEDTEKNVYIIYTQYSKCRKCGSVCKEIQLWSKDGNKL